MISTRRAFSVARDPGILACLTGFAGFRGAEFIDIRRGRPMKSAITEDGTYTLNGAVSGVSVSKNVGATVWIPSESETLLGRSGADATATQLGNRRVRRRFEM